jgi:hypothetical protein
VSQLIVDINYADTTGGAFTINLAPNTIFDLKSVNNTTDGPNGLPVIGGMKAVDLTILGNGDTIERVSVTTNKHHGSTNYFRLFDVAPGASLTFDHVTLQGGSSGSGGAIYNQGTLKVINGSILSGNSGGGISNNTGGTVAVSNSTLSNNSGSGISNTGGTVAVSKSSLSNNSQSGISNTGGMVTVSYSTLSGNNAGQGGGIYNGGGTVAISNSTLSGNYAGQGGGIYNGGGTVAISNSTLSGNTASNGIGGGICNAGTVTVNSSTLSGNSAEFGGGIYNAGTLTLNGSTLFGNWASPDYENGGGDGGGILNDFAGTVIVENNSTIAGNAVEYGRLGPDVYNGGVLYLDSTSTIGGLDGNPAIPI